MLFGSGSTGLALATSDLDVTVLLPGVYLSSDTHPLIAVLFSTIVQKPISFRPSCCLVLLVLATDLNDCCAAEAPEVQCLRQLHAVLRQCAAEPPPALLAGKLTLKSSTRIDLTLCM